MRRGLRFIVLIREDLKVQTFADVITKAELSPQLFIKNPESTLVRPESNSRPPAWQPDAQPTEPPVGGVVRRGLSSLSKIEMKKSNHL